MRAILPDAIAAEGRAYRRGIEPIGLNWGATADELARPFSCDHHLPDADDACFRAVTVDAPAPVVFRRLCQLKLAPYSYDWIDNWGRRSPQELVPGAEKLEVGERFVSIFRLVEFEIDRHLTLVLVRARRVFGDVAISYVVVPERADRCRLVVKLLVNHPGPAVLRPLVRWVGPVGDLVMMRRQLLNLKALAERDAAAQAGSATPASRP
jgi:hypothetical protein